MIAGNKTTVNGSMNYYVQESPGVKRRCYAFVKRAFDIVASAAALIILSPIMLIAAILVYVDDPGKVFYGHVRIGKNGKPFKMWKFRSMYMNADKMIDLLTPEQAKQYYTEFKIDNDTHPELEWAKDSRLIMITAHRRENLGEPMCHMFKAIRRVMDEHPDVKAIYPIHMNRK